MGNEESRESGIIQELHRLKGLFVNGDYFTVVILAPQLMVEAIDVLASYQDAWIERKITSKFSDDDNEVYRLVGQLQKKESDRSYIVGALLVMYENGLWKKSSAKRSFVKYFTKLDDLVSLRNIYAHEYYTKEVSQNRSKTCAKSAIEIIELFVAQFEQ